MKIQRRQEPKTQENYFTDIPKVEDVSPVEENDSVSILSELWQKEDSVLGISRKITFSANLIYLIGLVTYIVMIFRGYAASALPSLSFVTLEVFVFNALLYWLTKNSKIRRDKIFNLYNEFEFKRLHGKK